MVSVVVTTAPAWRSWSIARRQLDLGLRQYSRQELERIKAAGETLDIQVLGLAVIAADVPAVASNALAMIYGDIRRAYQIVDRTGIRVLRDPYSSKPNVSFYNRFVEIDELIEFIGMADIYITPYLNPAQITSGTLAYAFGCDHL